MFSLIYICLDFHKKYVFHKATLKYEIQNLNILVKKYEPKRLISLNCEKLP